MVRNRQPQPTPQRHSEPAAASAGAGAARAALDAAPLGLALLDDEATILFANPRWLEASRWLSPGGEGLGVGSDVVDGCLRQAAAGQAGATEIASALRRVLSGSVESLALECSGRVGGGTEERWFGVSLSRLSGRGPERVLAAITDLTPQKEAERALRESEERYRRIVDLAEEGIWQLDAEARTAFVNARMAQLLGYTPEEMLGRSLFSFIDAAEVGAYRLRWEQRRRGARERFDARFLRKDGSPLWAIVSTTPLYSPDGRFAGSLGMIADITDRKLAEDRARHLQNEISHVSRLAVAGEMSAELAHELNQPLAAIASYTQAALVTLRRSRPAPPPEEAVESIRKAEEQARRAGHIIRHLAAFVRKREHRRSTADVNQGLEEIGGLASASARHAGAPVRFELQPGLPLVLLDRIQIQQVILNLVRNAADAVQAAGKPAEAPIIIRTARQEWPAAVVVSVEDRGSGLAEADPARLFQPFYTTKSGGMGLGLAISRTIVESHGGRLWAEPNTARAAPGLAGGPGAAFRFTIPIPNLVAGDGAHDR